MWAWDICRYFSVKYPDPLILQGSYCRSTATMEEDNTSNPPATFQECFGETLEMPFEEPTMPALEASEIDQAIQYAHENNLTADYTLGSFSISHIFKQPILSTMPPTIDDDLTEDSHLTELELPVVSPYDKTLKVTSTAMMLIKEARRILHDDEAQQLTKQVCDATITRNLEIELPILRTDNEWDMRQYHKENLARHPALIDSITNHTLPLDTPDVAKGESMELSAEVWMAYEAKIKKFEEEKIGVIRESLQYLAGMMRDEYTREDQLTFLIEVIKYEKVSNCQLPAVPSACDEISLTDYIAVLATKEDNAACQPQTRP